MKLWQEFENFMLDAWEWLTAYRARKVVAVVTLAVLVLTFWAGRASAQQLDQEGCITLAVWSRDIIWAREVGANKELVRGSLVEMNKTDPHPVMVLLLRQFEHLWNTRVPRMIVMEMQYQECARLRGDYGRGT